MALNDDEPLPLYPRKSTKRGIARIHLDNRSFYFGRHGTPESYELFAEWLRELATSGVPPETNEVRARLSRRRPLSRMRQIWSRWLIAIVAVALTASVSIVATHWEPEVEGKPLSKREITRIVMMRYFESLKDVPNADPKEEALKAEIIWDRVMSGGIREGEDPEEQMQRVFGDAGLFTPIIPEREPGESLEDYMKRVGPDLKPLPPPELPAGIPGQVESDSDPIDQK